MNRCFQVGVVLLLVFLFWGCEAVQTGVETSSPESTLSAPSVSTATPVAPIVGGAFDVALNAKKGSKNTIFAKRTKVALAGYNVGALHTAKISGSTSRGQGARASMSFELEGVDAAMLQTIADLGHADLVSQLEAAGVNVIDAPTLFAAPEAKEIIRVETAKGEIMDGRAPKKLLVAGPTGIGVVKSFGQVPQGFNMNIGDKASAVLDAIVIYPNTTLDFAWTSGGGRSMFKRKASVSGGVRFALDGISNCTAIYSKKGRFVDASAVFALGEDVGVDDEFYVMAKSDSSNNSGAVAVSNALGLGMASRKGDKYVVTADPEKYKALALKALKGYNAALVHEIKAGKGL